MKNENRTNKKGNKLVATVKSYMVSPKEDIQTGKLMLKGEISRYYSDVKYDRTIKAGEKVCLRIAFKRYDGSTLVYLHCHGWVIVNNLN